MNMEQNMNKEADVHLWNHCHHCGADPIVGNRYQCKSCPDGPDNDLCEKCYELYQSGQAIHPHPDSLGASLKIKEHPFEKFIGKPGHMFKEWLRVKHPTAPDPQFPDRFLVRPIFNAGSEAVIGGYAFVTKIEGASRPLAITALHVMDELIKKLHIDCTSENMLYTGKELPSLVNSVNLFDLFAPNWMMAPLGDASPMLVLPEARVGEEEPFSHRDICAFWVESKDISQFNPVPLAPQSPGVGEPIWLAARSMENPNQRLFKAVVVELTERSMVFMYDDNVEKPKYSSGAPLLNAKGEIVGLLVGGGKLEGQRIGHANHVNSIRRHLQEALR